MLTDFVRPVPEDPPVPPARSDRSRLRSVITATGTKPNTSMAAKPKPLNASS